MFGMIRNSLFGGTEIRPCQTLSSETKGDFSYEVRKYEPAKYASVTVTGKPFDEASGEGVLKLLKYVGGSNEQGVGMGMTAPVTIRAHRGDQGGLQPGVLVQIRIPSKYQEQPPRPTDQSITVQHQEGFTVYSTSNNGCKTIGRRRTALTAHPVYQALARLCNTRGHRSIHLQSSRTDTTCNAISFIQRREGEA
uniref:Heme-binding protein 1 n=1 Tax=Callorhinchus milii TaxID=7868 RepID=A0A4W3JRI8_CALMI